MNKDDLEIDDLSRLAMEKAPFGYLLGTANPGSRKALLEFICLDTNREFERMCGLHRREILQRKFADVLAGSSGEEISQIERLAEAALRGREREIAENVKVFGSRFQLKVYSPRPNCAALLFIDIAAELAGAEFSRRFIDDESARIDYQAICEQMHGLSGAKAAVFNLFDENGLDFTTVAVSGTAAHLNGAARMLGFSLVGRHWKHDPVRAQKIRGSVVTAFDALHDLTGTILDPALIASLERLTGIGRTYVVSIMKDDRMLGDFTLIMSRKAEIKSRAMVELFASQIGLFLEKRKAEESLSVNERNFGTFFESLDDMAFVLDEKGAVLKHNRSAGAKLGRSEEELAGRDLALLIPQPYRGEIEKLLETLEPGRVAEAVHPVLTSSGGPVDVESRLWLGSWDGRKCSYFLSKDLTREKEALERFNRLFESSPAMMTVRALPEGVFTEVNQVFLEKTGYTRREVIGKTAEELDLPELRAEYLLSGIRVSPGESLADREIRFISKEGRQYEALLSGEIIESRDGFFLLDVALDVTESNRRERLLEAVTAMTQEFLENRKYLDVVPGAFALVGRTLDISRIYLFQNCCREQGVPETTSQKFEWNAGDALPQIDNPELQQVSIDTMDFFIEPLARGEPFSAVVSKLEAGRTKTILSAQGIVSILVLPVMVKGRFWGFVGFDECRYQRTWSRIEQSVLELFVLSLERAIEREEDDQLLVHSEAKNRAMLEAFPDLFFTLSCDGRIIDYEASGARTRLYRPPGEFLGRHIEEIFPPDMAKQTIAGIRRTLTERRMTRFEYSLDLDGDRLWFESRMMPLSDAAVLAVSRDITEMRTLELALAQEKQLLETTLISVGDGVISTDTTGRIVFLNRAAEELTGWSMTAARGRPLYEVFNIIDEHTRRPAKDIAAMVLKEGRVVQLDSHTLLVTRSGSERAIDDSAAPILQADGTMAGIVLVFRDVSEKKRQQAEIEYLGTHDQLTGVRNRRSFEQEVGRLDSDEYLPLGVIMLDVNGLKLVNDAFGHQSGDLLLGAAASEMAAMCREQDIAARIGGDEFVMLLPGTDGVRVQATVEELRARISAHEVESIQISVSMGWSVRERTDVPFDEVLRRAEEAMYARKLSESTSMRYRSVEVIMNTLCEKSPFERFHSQRVGALCVAIGEALGLHQERLEELRIVGVMHDAGKIAVDTSLLLRVDPLSESEKKLLQRHSEVGYQILKAVNEYASMADAVLAHHERWDGCGYPRGLSGTDIPLEARIIAVADAYDAMTSQRPHRKALAREEAVRELLANAGSQFDPGIVSRFIEAVLPREL